MRRRTHRTTTAEMTVLVLDRAYCPASFATSSVAAARHPIFPPAKPNVMMLVRLIGCVLMGVASCGMLHSTLSIEKQNLRTIYSPTCSWAGTTGFAGLRFCFLHRRSRASFMLFPLRRRGMQHPTEATSVVEPCSRRMWCSESAQILSLARPPSKGQPIFL